MIVKAQRVSQKSDMSTLCCPSDGYDDSIDIELNQNEEIDKINGPLPKSDQKYPKGAPIQNYAVHKHSVLRKN